MGIFSINKSMELNNIINDFINHLFTISNAIKDVKINILSIHNELSYVVINSSYENLIEAQIAVNKYEQETLDLLKIIETQFPGDVKKVILLRETFIQPINNHHDVLNLLIEKKAVAAEEVRINEDKALETTIDNLTEELLLVADYKAKEFQKNALINYNDTRRKLIYSIGATLLILLACAYFLARSITYPMNKLKQAIKTMVDGSEPENIDKERLDEIGQITRSVLWLFTELKIQKRNVNLFADNSLSYIRCKTTKLSLLQLN